MDSRAKQPRLRHMGLIARYAGGMLCLLMLGSGAALADKSAYLDMARRGWVYELRSTMVGRDMSIPVHINGRDLKGAPVCLVGEPPTEGSRAVLEAFRALLGHVHGVMAPLREAGGDISACGTGRMVILRLYSGGPPNRALGDDLEWMDRVYELGLPERHVWAASSPAMAQAFFGRNGSGAHVMVQQAAPGTADPVDQAYFRSLLVEELFQTFTFGMDILHLDAQAPFLSKLEENPLRLRRAAWGSSAFKSALLASNPAALCAFDIFMLHAVARAPVDQTTTPEFLGYIDARFASLQALTGATMDEARFAPVLDPACAPQDAGKLRQ